MSPKRRREQAIHEQGGSEFLTRNTSANALRHSFGSYRIEMVKNAWQVALENGQQPKTASGISPRMSASCNTAAIGCLHL
jgi:hypothetical protein